MTLNSTTGGFVCSDCYKEGYIVSDKTIKLARIFYYVDIDKISKIEIIDKNLKEINMFIDNYYDRYTGIYLKSKDFLKSLSKL